MPTSLPGHTVGAQLSVFNNSLLNPGLEHLLPSPPLWEQLPSPPFNLAIREKRGVQNRNQKRNPSGSRFVPPPVPESALRELTLFTPLLFLFVSYS